MIASTLSPVHFVILAVALAAIAGLVIFAVRKIVRRVKNGRGAQAAETN